MNISPVSMMTNMRSFGCSKCEEVKKIICEDSPKEEKTAYTSMGSDYFYPVSIEQINEYEENARKSREKMEQSRPQGELEGETLEEFLERHKLEWSM